MFIILTSQDLPYHLHLCCQWLWFWKEIYLNFILWHIWLNETISGKFDQMRQVFLQVQPGVCVCMRVYISAASLLYFLRRAPLSLSHIIPRLHTRFPIHQAVVPHLKTPGSKSSMSLRCCQKALAGTMGWPNSPLDEKPRPASHDLTACPPAVRTGEVV